MTWETGIVAAVILVFLISFVCIRRGNQLSTQYHAAVKFQLGATQIGFYNPKRVGRMRRARVSPQNAAWLLLNENRRSEDKV